VPREKDDQAISRWLATDWLRLEQKARRRGACLMLDESGLLMAPLLRRTWALRVPPPESRYRKAEQRQKVSVAAGLGLPPDRAWRFLEPLSLWRNYCP
jgi:hypothetical protein